MGWFRDNTLRANPATMAPVLFNTPGGKNLWKEMLHRVPDKGELVYERDTKYKVTGVATFSGKPVGMVDDFEIRSTAYVVWLEKQ